MTGGKVMSGPRKERDERETARGRGWRTMVGFSQAMAINSNVRITVDGTTSAGQGRQGRLNGWR